MSGVIFCFDGVNKSVNSTLVLGAAPSSLVTKWRKFEVSEPRDLVFYFSLVPKSDRHLSNTVSTPVKYHSDIKNCKYSYSQSCDLAKALAGALPHKKWKVWAQHKKPSHQRTDFHYDRIRQFHDPPISIIDILIYREAVFILKRGFGYMNWSFSDEKLALGFHKCHFQCMTKCLDVRFRKVSEFRD